ncbi:MAG: helix-turn-helix transcriptional regulator [Oscillospiraceae bacterium]|nr:helix-turn-helix transcriptional regulator [Oscillospiraceae bacterium]
MDNNIIGNQITKFRKAAGLTQEELGKAVGVSTQAVSRWECGGAPDVALLPAIADRLGVTVDALFGREGGEVTDINEEIKKWAATVPKEHIHEKLNRLVFSAIGANNFVAMEYVEKCEDDFGCLINSYHSTDGGNYFGVNAEDMSFSAICPKPEKGYNAYFADKEAYRKFFGVLSMPHVLEMLEFLLSENTRLFTSELLAQKLSADTAEIEETLEKMQECHLVYSTDFGTIGGLSKIYGPSIGCSYIPFLYLARCILEDTQINFLGSDTRTKPYFHRPEE